MLEKHISPKPELVAARKDSTAVLRSAVAGLAASALLASSAASWAFQMKFYANLNGGSEAPPNHSAGIGHLDAIFDTDTNILRWTVHYADLAGSPITAHFRGPVSYTGTTYDADAPVQIGKFGRMGSPFQGSAVLDAAQVEDLIALRWYFNVYTSRYPGGEIRGPVVRW